MEPWKLSIIIGAGLIILALIFAYAKKGIGLLIGLAMVLGIIDIILGLYLKNKN